MVGIRQKLSLGFGGLFLLITIIGIYSIQQLSHLGAAIDVILRENYRSVVACEDMKEAIERVDSGILFTIMGYQNEGINQIDLNSKAFEQALHITLNNITLPGEGEQAQLLQNLFSEYRKRVNDFLQSGASLESQRDRYFSQLLPLFLRIKDTANDILNMNQQNMHQANDQARSQAAAAQSRMYVLLFAGSMVAIVFMYLTGRWILQPINELIRSAEEIKRGNLDLVVRSISRDEIGQLAERFNDMAASLRELRRSDRAKLARIQRATQQAFRSLPDAVALINPEGSVETATDAARDLFGLKPGVDLKSLPLHWLFDLFDRALSADHPVELPGDEKVLQRFVQGEERYFRPEAVPILDYEMQPTGVVLVFKDMTQLRHQDDLKRGLVSTVSHQLRTPLTSIRMAIHLLLEEKVGSLNNTQTELLVAAREDSDRLDTILTNLLDISRIESGKMEMQLRSVSPHTVVLEATEPFRRTAEDQGVSLQMSLPEDIPDIWVDPAQIGHVFSNLFTNALRYTSPGGQITLSASSTEDVVVFSISDTGTGIPREYLPRIFDPFFRVPEEKKETGVGLGLAIVKEIVEAHGGSVSVESREGEGSTFRFSLKRADRGSETENHL